jgi:hypothetical protein
MTLIDQFRSARRVSTPLVGITTADPFACIRALAEALNGKAPLSQPKRAVALVDFAQRRGGPQGVVFPPGLRATTPLVSSRTGMAGLPVHSFPSPCWLLPVRDGFRVL